MQRRRRRARADHALAIRSLRSAHIIIIFPSPGIVWESELHNYVFSIDSLATFHAVRGSMRRRCDGNWGNRLRRAALLFPSIARIWLAEHNDERRAKHRVEQKNATINTHKLCVASPCALQSWNNMLPPKIRLAFSVSFSIGLHEDFTVCSGDWNFYYLALFVEKDKLKITF
jgi:hypothetical protein